MSVAHRVTRLAARAVRFLARLTRRLLRTVAFLLFLALALVLPVPIFGRPHRYEHAGRKNEPTEVEKRH